MGASTLTEKRFLSGRDVMAMFGLTGKSNRTLRAWEQQGRLHPIRINQRVVVYDPQDVERMIEEGRAR